MINTSDDRQKSFVRCSHPSRIPSNVYLFYDDDNNDGDDNDGGEASDEEDDNQMN